MAKTLIDAHSLNVLVKAGLLDQNTANLLLMVAPITSVPAESGLTERDVELAIAEWDKALPAYAGLLEPGVTTNA